MAHNINEGRIFYIREKPWHGIGVKLDKPATAQEAIQAARLDYQVEKQPIRVIDGPKIPDRFATVRMDTNQVLGVVGNQYQILANTKAFDFFDNVVGTGDAMYHTAGALGRGERIWILAKLPKDILVFKDDIVEKYLVLTNSHDGYSALRMYFTPIRVVCQNTLNMSLSAAKDGISIRHSGDINNKVNEARRILGLALDYYGEFEETAQEMVRHQLKKAVVERYFEKVITRGQEKKEETSRARNIKNEMLNLFEHGKGNNVPGVRGTAWAAYNAVTEFVDHARTVKGTQKDETKRLSNIWFGSGANMKQRAYTDILQTIGAGN